MFSTKAISWLALVVIFVCAGLITLQVLEFQYFRAEPSVWLKP